MWVELRAKIMMSKHARMQKPLLSIGTRRRITQATLKTYNGQRLKVVNRGESRALQTEYISDNRS